MTNLSNSAEQQTVSTISSLKTIIEGMEELLKNPENQSFQVADIINKFLTNSAELSGKIQSENLREVTLDSLKTSEQLVMHLIPPRELMTYSRKLVESIKQSISSENQRSARSSGDNVDEIVLLVSILLLILNIQNQP